MPAKKNFRKKPPKAPKRNTRALTRQMPRLVIGGFPKSNMVKLRYCEEITINPGSGSIAVHTFSANGLWDPSLSSVGHQPANFDPWMERYDHYTVLSSKITMKAINDETVNLGQAGILLTDLQGTTTTLANIVNIVEQPQAKLMRNLVGNSAGASTRSKMEVTHTFSASAFFGKTKQTILGDDQYRGNISKNPDDGAYFECFVAAIIGNDPGQLNFLVTVDYIAILSERKVSQRS